MCGRFSLGLPRHAIARLPGHDDLDVDEWVDEDNFYPRHNIAPHSNAPVIRHADRRGPANHEATETSTSSAEPHPKKSIIMHTMNWGLIPHWSRFRDNSLNTTNARSENLVEGGGMWNSIKGRKRCAVVCQGYFEWQKKGKERIPHFTKHKDDRLMLLAGMYDCVTLEGEKEPLWSFTIVTTAAASSFTWLHDRQPVILSTREALDAWLDTSSQTWSPALSKLVELPYSDESAPLECYAVPKEVGKVGTESSTFIEPVAQRKDGIAAMFKKQEIKQDKKPGVASSSKPSLSPKKPIVKSEPAASPAKLKRESANPEPSSSRPKNLQPMKRKRESPEVLDLTLSDDEQESPEPKKMKKEEPKSSPVKNLRTSPKKAATAKTKPGS